MTDYRIIDDVLCEQDLEPLLLFDASRPHRSTNCADDWRRVNINFNYF